MDTYWGWLHSNQDEIPCVLPVLQTFFPALKLPLSHFEHTSSSLKSFDHLIKIRVFILINTVEIFSVSRKSKNRISCAVITLLLYPCSEFYKKHLLSLLEKWSTSFVRYGFHSWLETFYNSNFCFVFYLDSCKGEESEHGLNLSIFFETGGEEKFSKGIFLVCSVKAEQNFHKIFHITLQVLILTNNCWMFKPFLIDKTKMPSIYHQRGVTRYLLPLTVHLRIQVLPSVLLVAEDQHTQQYRC